jgi:thioredoxin reductase (NADPH)
MTTERNIKEEDRIQSIDTDVLIIGGGPAGSTAAIYAGRAGLDVTVMAGTQPSMLSLSPHVENFPGFDGPGVDLLEKVQEQARLFGADVRMEDATEITLSERKVNGIRAGTIIIATGTVQKMLGLDREDDFLGKGVSTCATCDGAFFRGRDVAIVGGGDAAVEEARYLSKMARSVTLIHRRKDLRAVTTPREDNIRLLLGHEVVGYLGDSVIEGVQLKNGEILTVQGVFLAIGANPNSRLFCGQFRCDDHGFIKHRNQTTDIGGVFVAGDVCDPMYRQAIVASAHGCMAAIQAIKFLRESHDRE